VKLRRALLYAILVYVTLDLSLPMMPGAFVFEPGDSVESIQTNRGRAVSGIAVLRAVVRDPFVLSQPRLDVNDRLVLTNQVAPLERPVAVSGLPRSALGPAPSSEGPH
jgi:hypothetical protein